MPNNITSADSILILSVAGLLPVPQQIQGFSTDDIFSTANAVPVETMMGIDGNLAGGYVPTEKKTTFSLMASSASNDFFDAWQAGQDANYTAYSAGGLITIPSLGKVFLLTNGFLTGYVAISDAKKVLQPRRFEVTWQSIVGSPIGFSG